MPLVPYKGDHKGIRGRVIGGKIAVRDEEPFMVHLTDGNMFCGGSILKHNLWPSFT